MGDVATGVTLLRPSTDAGGWSAVTFGKAAEGAVADEAAVTAFVRTALSGASGGGSGGGSTTAYYTAADECSNLATAAAAASAWMAGLGAGTVAAPLAMGPGGTLRVTLWYTDALPATIPLHLLRLANVPAVAATAPLTLQQVRRYVTDAAGADGADDEAAACTAAFQRFWAAAAAAAGYGTVALHLPTPLPPSPDNLLADGAAAAAAHLPTLRAILHLGSAADAVDLHLTPLAASPELRDLDARVQPHLSVVAAVDAADVSTLYLSGPPWLARPTADASAAGIMAALWEVRRTLVVHNTTPVDGRPGAPTFDAFHVLMPLPPPAAGSDGPIAVVYRLLTATQLVIPRPLMTPAAAADAPSGAARPDAYATAAIAALPLVHFSPLSLATRLPNTRVLEGFASRGCSAIALTGRAAPGAASGGGGASGGGTGSGGGGGTGTGSGGGGAGAGRRSSLGVGAGVAPVTAQRRPSSGQPSPAILRAPPAERAFLAAESHWKGGGSTDATPTAAAPPSAMPSPRHATPAPPPAPPPTPPPAARPTTPAKTAGRRGKLNHRHAAVDSDSDDDTAAAGGSGAGTVAAAVGRAGAIEPADAAAILAAMAIAEAGAPPTSPFAPPHHKSAARSAADAASRVWLPTSAGEPSGGGGGAPATPRRVIVGGRPTPADAPPPPPSPVAATPPAVDDFAFDA